MADYYPLLARALDALPDRSPGLRRAVYDRARNALLSQLRSLEPPLSEDDIDLERRALDAAIERLEVEHGGIPSPANDAAARAAAVPPPAPVAPEPPPPAASETAIDLPEPEAAVAEPAPLPPPALPPASSPRFVLKPEPVSETPREAAIAITPRRSQTGQETEFLPAPPAPVEASEPKPSTEPEVGSETAQGRQRPRIDVVAPKGRRSRILRNVVIGIVLVAVIGAIAVAAFLLRDNPQLASRANSDAVPLSTDNPDSKFNDRVGGDGTSADRPKALQEGAAPKAAPPPVAAQPGVAVAQRAFLIEEASGAENAQPISSTGRVTWRLDTTNGDQGQPLQTTAAATIAYPDVGLTLTMTIQKNLDATLPASHTISLAFSQSGADPAPRVVQDVGLLQAKDDENGRGSPVSGLPVRVRDNLFLIGLSSLPSDVERNTDLLLNRPWFDIAIRYTSGKRAVLTFEKGAAGEQVLQQAFDAWK